MGRIVRSPSWAIVAVLLGLYLAHDLGAKQAAAPSNPIPTGKLVRIEYIPDPNDIVNLVEGTPYTVPEGKLLIITDWVTTDALIAANVYEQIRLQPRIRINSVDVWGGGYSSLREVAGNSSEIASTGTFTVAGSLRSGLRAKAGDVVTLVTNKFPLSGWDGIPTTFASGYLADEN